MAVLSVRVGASAIGWGRALLTASVVAALLVAPPLEQTVLSETTQSPNILIFMTDDQRADTMGVMPKTRKWFKERGIRYPKGFVVNPLCCPSRATLFTGQYAHNHGVRTNGDATLLDPDATVQRYLREGGYRTALVGKYLNRWDVTVSPEHFDRFAMLRHHPGEGYHLSTFNVDGTVRTVTEYSTDFLRRTAVAILRDFDAEDDGAPWLMYVTPFAPHGPADASAKYEGSKVRRWRPSPANRETDRSDKPPYVQDQHRTVKTARWIRARQLRSLRSVDDLVGRVMTELQYLGEGRRTLAFFLSDNGLLWAEHGWEKGKRVAYTPAIRVPFFARWPGHLPGGAVDRRIAANVDLAPTILAAAGVTPDHPMDGRSLFGPAGRDHLLIESWRDDGVPPWASIRTRKYQYVEWYAEDLATVVFREYYDLVNDPWQLENLLGNGEEDDDPSADTLTALSVLLERDRRCVGIAPGTGCP